MNKFCSNCGFEIDGYCPEHRIKTKVVPKACPSWKRKSTTQQFYDKRKRQSIRRRSIKQEKQVAKETGGKRQPMSGAGYHKGDVKTKFHLIEIKFTDKNSYALNKDIMKKIFYESVYESSKRDESIVPYLQIRMGKDNYCVLRKEDFDVL